VSRSHVDLGITAAVAMFACGAAIVGAPVAVTALLGIALFAAVGYLLSQLLLGSRLTGLERLAVATGLAFCVPIFGGLLLYFARVPLHRASWLGLLVGVTLVGDVALFLRRRAQRALHSSEENRWHLPMSHVVLFGAAVVIAVGAVGLARAGSVIQHYPGFTQLWLAHPKNNSPTANLGVGNYEGRAMRYRLVILHNGHPAATLNLTLANGQTWHQSPAFTERYTISVNLYRLPDLTHPYRHVAIDKHGMPNT
jgi:hypothetical protein